MSTAQLSPDPSATAVGGELRLPRPPGVIRRFWARHPLLVDCLVAGFYVLSILAALILAAATGPVPLWVTVARIVLVAATAVVMVLFRRSNPWLLVGAAWVTTLVVYPLENVNVFAIPIGLYALAVYRSTRAAWIGFAVSAVVGTAAALVASLLEPGPLLPTQPFFALAAAEAVVTALIGTLIGINVGNRRRYVQSLIARVGDLARERDQQAQLATARERARIAREMHDIVSHSLTVMVTLAEGSAATVSRDPDRAAEGMRHVADAGRDALVEMRRMLGVLTEPGTMSDEGRAPQPGSAAMPELLESFRAAGLPVKLTTSGRAITDPNLQLTVYRIVQEALTNALRHAPSARSVDVSIEHVDGEVRVEVVDDAEGSRQPHRNAPQNDTGGHGLIGMRERVALYGGTLDAGPRGVNGWRVRAVLPSPDRPDGAGE
ncbi:signal transduction histidine kinase [Microbacterium sp. SLBN-154]|uniref:sensor histidine kinase n=1 Tax=Microbacterium sp. SLBN-154 TaxID=2768458 RepID=UPI001153DC94|nr:sensor histidine kinase [Microbacterium sp. SLBN-154]TQK18679.1 signal transduction histidine kinase [Microbacterium sp. SLBN-154]